MYGYIYTCISRIILRVSSFFVSVCTHVKGRLHIPDLFLYIHVYMYTYIHVYMYTVYMYTYIHM